jgi:hypothetical protein
VPYGVIGDMKPKKSRTLVWRPAEEHPQAARRLRPVVVEEIVDLREKAAVPQTGHFPP